MYACLAYVRRLSSLTTWSELRPTRIDPNVMLVLRPQYPYHMLNEGVWNLYLPKPRDQPTMLWQYLVTWWV